MIRSTFSGFTTAQHALLANQRAIDVAGQNLSNINTAGYTRQRLDLSSISPVGNSLWSSSTDNKVGQGVRMMGISQIRDPFLDIQYRNQIAKVGTADATDQILQQIGQIFDETDKAAIGDALNKVISELKNVANIPNAGESSSDALVRSTFQTLINTIHQNATKLDGVETETIQKLTDTLIPNINKCLTGIKELNNSIKNSQILGNPSLELQDQRNQLLDDLASYLPIQVKYKEDTTAGTKVDVLQVTFRDTDGNVHTLIDDDKAAEFKLDSTGGIPVSLKITDAADPGMDNIEVSDLLGNGVLKGNLDMLNKAEIFDDPTSDVRGIGYYRGLFDSFVNKMASVMNDLNAEKDADGNITVRHDLFTTSDGSGRITASNIKVSEDWMNGKVTLKREQKEGIGGTSSSSQYDNILLMVNALSSDKLTFTNNKQLLDNDGNPVLDDKGNPVYETIFQGTIQGCYNNIQNIQAIERAASSTMLENHMTVLNQIADSKDSVSGVSLDEEVMDLMRYQQSYNAASRLMTTLDELLDKLINSTGIIGR